MTQNFTESFNIEARFHTAGSKGVPQNVKVHGTKAGILQTPSKKILIISGLYVLIFIGQHIVAALCILLKVKEERANGRT